VVKSLDSHPRAARDDFQELPGAAGHCADRFRLGNSRQGGTRLFLVLLLLFVASPERPVNAQATSDRDRLKSLVTRWIGQRTEIVSTHINAKVYRYVAGAGAPGDFSSGLVEQIAAELAHGTGGGRISRVHELLPNQGIAGKSSWGFDLEVVTDGTTLRNVKKFELAPFGTVVEDWIFDGVKTLEFHSANEDVTIKNGLSVPETFRLDSFRYIPKVDQETLVDRFSILSRVDDVLQIKRADQSFTVENETGFVRHFRQVNMGKILEEVYQFVPAIGPGGIVVPTVHVRVIYDKSSEKVAVLDIFDISHFECNIPGELSEFQMSVPGNTLIRDFRDDANRETKYVTQRKVDDVLTYIKNPGQSSHRETIWWLVLINVLGLLLIFLGAKLYSKKRGDRSG
jgi:hypothetical protein